MAKETYRVWLDDEEELDAYVIYANDDAQAAEKGADQIDSDSAMEISNYGKGEFFVNVREVETGILTCFEIWCEAIIQYGAIRITK
jgi:hypothetical protein